MRLEKEETRATAAWALDQILHLAHPIMPFMTEELWQSISTERSTKLIASTWPTFNDDMIDHEANAEVDWVVRLVSQIRGIRSEMNVPVAAKIPMMLKDPSDHAAGYLDRNAAVIERLARISSVEVLTGEVPKGAVQDVIDEATLLLPIAEVIDLDEEKSRLEREIAKQDKEIDRFEKKLGNEKFVANAPESVVETERERLADAQMAREKLMEAHKRLSAAG